MTSGSRLFRLWFGLTEPVSRTEGLTVYDMRIFPAAYWSLWTDALTHSIQERVLGHIKALSEASVAA